MTDEPTGLPIPMRLAAGDLTFEFEPWSGWLRNVRYRGVEIVYAMYATTRDENWGTPKATISDVKLEPTEAGWRLTWRAEYDHWSMTGRLRVSADALIYTVDGEAKKTFKTRRTGLCVLHPARQAGRPFSVNGKPHGFLPTHVQPDSPATDVREIGITESDFSVDLTFKGEEFEMEDQRNWSDVSFKTYCRQQRRPQPYEVAKGEFLSHSCAVIVDDQRLVTFSELNHRSPEIGLVGAPNPEPWQVHRIEALKLDFIHAGHAPWPAPKRRVVESWNPSRETPDSEAYVVVPGDFVNLNRDRPDFAKWKGIGFSPNCMVHSADSRTAVENSQGAAMDLASAKALAGHERVIVGPTRFGGGRDARLHGAVGTAWLAATLVGLIREGCEAVTLIPTHGEGGLLTTIDHPNDLERVLSWAPRGGAKLFRVDVASPFVHAVGFERDGVRHALIVNVGVDRWEAPFGVTPQVVESIGGAVAEGKRLALPPLAVSLIKWS